MWKTTYFPLQKINAKLCSLGQCKHNMHLFSKNAVKVVTLIFVCALDELVAAGFVFCFQLKRFKSEGAASVLL